MKVGDRYKAVVERFKAEMPSPETELRYSNPYELLVAVVLSAQCTDKRVNMITPPLFEAYPDAFALAQATPEDIFAYIRSCSYPNNKAKALAAMARKLVADFGGEVPDTMEALTSLPGVGRKTANVILSVIFSRPAMAVDTHVFRVAERIGLTTRSRHRAQTGGGHPRGADIQGTPLAHTPRALCVQGAQARVRQLFHCRYMPLPREGAEAQRARA